MNTAYCFICDTNQAQDQMVDCNTCFKIVCVDCYRNLKKLICPFCRTEYPNEPCDYCNDELTSCNTCGNAYCKTCLKTDKCIRCFSSAERRRRIISEFHSWIRVDIINSMDEIVRDARRMLDDDFNDGMISGDDANVVDQYLEELILGVETAVIFNPPMDRL